MRFHYPLNDTPLFVYPAISIGDYDWEQTTPRKKMVSYVFGFFYLILFLFVFLIFTTHGYEITWGSVWKMIRGLFILALFPLFVLSVLFARGKIYPADRQYCQHRFFKDWAWVYTGIGKGRHSFFFAEDVESFGIETASFRGQSFFLVKVSFRRGFLGKRGDGRFGIAVPDEKELKPLTDWAEANRVELTFERAGEFSAAATLIE